MRREPSEPSWIRRSLYVLGRDALLFVGVALLFVGVLVLLGGMGLGVGLGVLWVNELRRRPLAGESLALTALVVSVGARIAGWLAAMGVTWLLARLRGSRPAMPRGSAPHGSWYGRSWYAVGLGLSTVWVLGAVLYEGFDAVFQPEGDVVSRIGGSVLLCHLVLPLQVALHELGHAGAGAVLGFRLVSVRVGWLTIGRDAGGVRVSWARPGPGAPLGLHHALPEAARMLRGRMAARAAAGPLASLLVALACRAGAVSLGGARGPAGTAEQVLWVAWWVGLSLAVINALPSRAPAGTLNDGALVAQALAGSGPGWVRYRFNVECALGHRPRDWAIPAPALLAALDDPGADRESLLLAAACVALDTGDDAQAGRILSRALDEPAPSPSMVRGELELQAAMLAAFQGRTAEARARLARVRGFGELPAYPRLAEAVLDACEGATEAAAAGLAAWEAALHGTGRASSIRVGNEWAVERLRSMVAASSRPRGAEA